MTDDIRINKSQIIRRCLARVREEYRGDPTRLDDFTIQDSIILNLQRACEAAIDLAMHFIAAYSLDTPQTSRDAFRLLHTAGVLAAETAARMQRMVGFRNIAVHDYQGLQLSIVQAIVEKHLGDFETFLEEIAAAPASR